MTKACRTLIKMSCRQKMIENEENEESFQVYCRVRPLTQTETSCIKVISDTSVQLQLQDTNSLSKQYTFKKVFIESSTQKELFEEVALPLVESLINSKSGLLLMHGVPGSGKTFTMMGTKQNLGVMPRCLDVLFNSISYYQVEKFIFKPDKMNGFEVQTEEEAERDRDMFLRKNTETKLNINNLQEDLLGGRSKDTTKIEVEEEYNAYAVFITYVEVYNNFVYDLLDRVFENEICQKPPLKIICGDNFGNTYVHGATQIEVKSTEEALEIFYKGEKRKRMCCTTLNMDSNRGHSIFTIKLVQAPYASAESVMIYKHMICVRQLSLVDLGGSEVTSGTENTSQCLNKAGKTNQSLILLRECLKTLRNNQQSVTQKIIPYRKHKITLLFKNFFERDSNIRMVICVNSKMTDADENASVMQFAEVTQDIIANPTPLTSTQNLMTPTQSETAAEFKKAYQLLEKVEEKYDKSFESYQQDGSYSNDYDHNEAAINCKEEIVCNEKLYDADVRRKRDNFEDTLPHLQQQQLLDEHDQDVANARHQQDILKMKMVEEKVIANPTPLTSTQNLTTPTRSETAAEFRKAYQLLEKVEENDDESFESYQQDESSGDNSLSHLQQQQANATYQHVILKVKILEEKIALQDTQFNKLSEEMEDMKAAIKRSKRDESVGDFPNKENEWSRTQSISVSPVRYGSPLLNSSFVVSSLSMLQVQPQGIPNAPTATVRLLDAQAAIQQVVSNECKRKAKKLEAEPTSNTNIAMTKTDHVANLGIDKQPPLSTSPKSDDDYPITNLGIEKYRKFKPAVANEDGVVILKLDRIYLKDRCYRSISKMWKTGRTYRLIGDVKYRESNLLPIWDYTNRDDPKPERLIEIGKSGKIPYFVYPYGNLGIIMRACRKEDFTYSL